MKIENFSDLVYLVSWYFQNGYKWCQIKLNKR